MAGVAGAPATAALVRRLTAGTAAGSRPRPRLLLLLAAADHPHRDPVCATLSWVAAEEGLLFECYWAAEATGGHFGGGRPSDVDASALRGGTFTGGRHLEQLHMVLQRFDCEVASLGDTVFTAALLDAGVRVRSWSGDVDTFYRDVFGGTAVTRPSTLLVVGRGEGEVDLRPFAFPEIVNRRLLAIASGDLEALAALRPGMSVETLWTADGEVTDASAVPAPTESTVATQTAWMARRWAAHAEGFLLGDGELVSRWEPTAVRGRLMPLYGLPQTEVIDAMAPALASHDVVIGRQQDDRDFLALSRLGTAFQLVDPGRPPFPIIREIPWSTMPTLGRPQEPSDEQLARWADQGRILGTMLFWTGMVRELENLYALADVLGLTGVHAGLVLTTESYAYMSGSPLALVDVPRAMGGLAPRVELLLASAGAGAMIESEAPADRFSAVLRRSVDELVDRLGDDQLRPRGWWSTMDAELEPHRPSRLAVHLPAPFIRVRYRPRGITAERVRVDGPAPSTIRARLRAGHLARVLEPLRPFDDRRPGAPSRAVLQAVRDAGFEYAFTKAGFGGPPRVVSGVDGLTTLTYTAGRWGGWTPFVTVDGIHDLRKAERRLLRTRRPGWLVGAVDTCLWAFSGAVWSRGAELREMCAWLAAGGSSGGVVNVTPHTVARYARLLADRGLVEPLAAA